MPLEVVPDLLSRVEIGRVTWKPFEVEPGIGIADRVDMGSLVNLTAVPQQDDMATQVPKQVSQECRHLACLEVVLSKLDV